MIYENAPFALLPHPSQTAIPFHQQAWPVPDPLQRHASVPERDVAESPYGTSNDLAKGRFLGTVWQQRNVPQFLGANERVAFV